MRVLGAGFAQRLLVPPWTSCNHHHPSQSWGLPEMAMEDELGGWSEAHDIRGRELTHVYGDHETSFGRTTSDSFHRTRMRSFQRYRDFTSHDQRRCLWVLEVREDDERRPEST